MLTRSRLALGVAGVAAAACGATAFMVSAPEADTGRERLSTAAATLRIQGRVVSVAPDARDRLRQARLPGTVRLLATRGDRSFYRLDASGLESCYATGPADAVGKLGVAVCPGAEFPSPATPVLDLSVVEVTRTSPRPHYVRVEGFAADGVESIALLDEEGRTAAVVPVQRNVYRLASPPPGAAVTLAGRDRGGEVVALLDR